MCSPPMIRSYCRPKSASTLANAASMAWTFFGSEKSVKGSFRNSASMGPPRGAERTRLSNARGDARNEEGESVRGAGREELQLLPGARGLGRSGSELDEALEVGPGADEVAGVDPRLPAAVPV